MDTKSNLATAQEDIATVDCVISPRATLGKLAAYMEAAGYAVDHPWRTEIAAALAAPVEVDASIEYALAAVNAGNLGASSIDELATFLETISALAEGSGAENGAVKKLAAIQRISRLACQFAIDRKETYGCVLDDLDESFAALQGGAQ